MTSTRSMPVAITIGLFLFSFSSIRAQQKPVFEQPVPNEDLTASEITALLQDPDGFIWIGTRNGLNRFDGKDVQQFFHDPTDNTSISHNEINKGALYFHAGYLWIGTADGLSRYDAASGTFKQYHFPSQDSLSAEPIFVRYFLATDTSSLWVGSSRGLFLLDLSSGELTVFNPVPLDATEDSKRANSISSMIVDPSGKLWLGTDKGVFSFSTESRTFTPLQFIHPDLNTIYSEYTYALAWEANNLWIGTASGLAYKNISNGHEALFFPAPENFPSLENVVHDILFDDSGVLWIASGGKGLCKFDQVSESFACFGHQIDAPFSLADDSAYSLILDYEGQIWVGTWNGASRMVRNAGFSTLTYDPEQKDNSLSNPRVRAIHEMQDGTLLLGTEDGLNVIDPSTGRVDVFRAQDGLSNNSLWNITEDGERIWITSEAGLNAWNPQTGKATVIQRNSTNGLVSSFMYVAFVDDQDTLWISSHFGGLSKLVDRSKHHIKTYTPSDLPDAISSIIAWPIYQHKSNELLIGTLGGGLNKLEIDKEKFTAYKPDSSNAYSISGEHVLTIAGDSLGQIWLGMQNTGLNRFDPDEEKFYNFTRNDGLANNEVLCILPEKDKRLWIATRNGLSVFDLTTETFIVNLYEQNGLPTSLFLANACEIGRSGMFRFGTEAGMVSFYPDSLDLNIPMPRVAISSFELNNKRSVLPPTNLPPQFPHDQNTLGFRVGGLSFIAPEKNTFSYRLLGQSDTWIDLGTSNFIYLPGLAPNDYTLEVRVVNSAGISNSTPFTYNFTIKPPYWETWWFRLLALAAILFLGGIFYQMRVKYLVDLAQKDIEKRRALENAQAENEQKILKLTREISNDFHDSFGSGLGSLGLEIDLYKQQSDLPEDLDKKFDYFRTRIDDLLEMRRDLGWIINASHAPLELLLERFKSVAHEIVLDPIQLQLDFQEALPLYQLGMNVRKNLLFLVREALYNAVRHANASKIRLSVSSIEEAGATCCIIQIEDDGDGFDPDTVKRGEGLNSMFARSRDIGGIMTIEPAIPHGTILKIQFDLKMDDSSYSNATDSDLD